MLFVYSTHGLIELFQYLQPGSGDPRLDHAAIVLLPFTHNQSALFHSVEQASHVRVVRNHPVAHNPAGKALRPRSTQDSQYVVLRSGQPVRLQELFALLCHKIRGAEKQHGNTLFDRGLVTVDGMRCTHGWNIVVITTIVKRKSYGRRDVLTCTSLTKLCGPCIAIIATACATASGLNTFVASFGPRPPNSVATLPGQTVLTRMPCSRSSSAIHPLSPCTAHFEAQ